MHRNMTKRVRASVTIRDVAERCGVSMMTVSNVLNERFQEMRATTRIRVEEAIQELGYRPHSVARHLRRSKFFSIGLLVIDEVPDPLAHPGTAHVIAGLANVLNAEGYSLTIQASHPKHISEALPIKNVGTDAVCILQSGTRAQRLAIIQRVSDSAQPCVLFHEARQPAGLDACCIRADDCEGGRRLAEHLLQRNCRSIVLVLPSTIWASMEERRRGVLLACRNADVRISVVRCGYMRIEEVHKALEAAFDAPDVPDAILAGNDQIGIGALRFLKQRSLSVPDQVRVTGFNAFDFWKYSDPLLTTVRTPMTELGARAGQELVSRLNGGSFSAREIVLPIELVQGQST